MAVFESTTGFTSTVGVVIGTAATVLTSYGSASTLGIIMLRHYSQVASLKYVGGDFPNKLNDRIEANQFASLSFDLDILDKKGLNSALGSN